MLQGGIEQFSVPAASLLQIQVANKQILTMGFATVLAPSRTNGRLDLISFAFNGTKVSMNKIINDG